MDLRCILFRMNHFFRCFLPGGAALALLCAPAARALDFQLDSLYIDFDGFRTEQPYIRYDDANIVYLTLPRGSWSATGSAAALTLVSSKWPTAQVRLEKSASPAADTDFKTPADVEAYRKRALASAPQGATGVSLVVERDMPADFFHWRDYEFVVGYDFAGQSFRRGVMFLDLDAKQQMVVTYVALPADFEAVRGTALMVLRSWQVKPLGR